MAALLTKAFETQNIEHVACDSLIFKGGGTGSASAALSDSTGQARRHLNSWLSQSNRNVPLPSGSIPFAVPRTVGKTTPAVGRIPTLCASVATALRERGYCSARAWLLLCASVATALRERGYEKNAEVVFPSCRRRSLDTSFRLRLVFSFQTSGSELRGGSTGQVAGEPGQERHEKAPADFLR